MHSGVFKEWQKNQLVIATYILGVSLYEQGAGFHSAANMFKNGFESVMVHHDDDTVQELYFWMRTVWEVSIQYLAYQRIARLHYH